MNEINFIPARQPRPTPPSPPRNDHYTTPPAASLGGVVRRGRRSEKGGAGWLAEKVAVSRRAARAEVCPRCGAAVWTGDDDDRCAARVSVEVEPVTRIEEVIAILRERSSFDLVRVAGGYAIYYRNPENLRTITPHSIHLLHVCPRKDDANGETDLDSAGTISGAG